MKEDGVLQALRALAENDGGREAPPETEARLRREFHLRRARRGWRWPAMAAVAAGVAIMGFLLANRTPKPLVRVVAGQPLSQALEVVRPSRLPVAAVAAPRRGRKLASVRRAEPLEVVTDFFPLMNPAPPFERGQMLRVQLPAAAMQAVGLPVREDHLADPIQADVLVGEEGMPRAIRFVRFEVQ
jgi:hypothetical protein